MRAPWHTLARLTNRRNHADLAVPGDRTLAAWIGWGFYYFAAYSKGINEKVDKIPYKVLDGEWNYVTFSYKKGSARGVVVFNGKEPVEVNIAVEQNLVNDYLRLIVGKEFGYQFFNGHYWNIQLRLGDGAFLTKDQARDLASGQQKLPD